MSDTGWKNAGTGSGLTNSSNITSSNDTYATATHTFTEFDYEYETLVATNFGFEVPTGATITGVQMRVECKVSGGTVMVETSMGEGPELQGVSSDRTDSYGSGIRTDESYIVYPPGSPEDDLWGATIGVSDVNGSSFGVSIPFSFSGEDETIDLYVDNVQMKVFYEPLNTGWVSPGTGSQDATGDFDWTNLSNISSDGDVVVNDGTPSLLAGESVTINNLIASNYSFSIPSGATIDGVEVKIYHRVYGSASVSLSVNSFKLVKDSTIVGDDGSADLTAGHYEYVEESSGGSSDMWGTTLSSSDVNSSNFGASVSYTVTNESPIDTGTNQSSLNVDYIQIKVYYTESSGTPTVGTKYALPAFKRP
jgi:hypothetical protein